MKTIFVECIFLWILKQLLEFSCEFREISKNNFITERLRATASVDFTQFL